MDCERFLNECPSPVFVIKPIYKDNRMYDFTYEYVNDAFSRFLGISKEKLLNNNYLSLFEYVERFWLNLFDKTIKEKKPSLIQSSSTVIEKNMVVQTFPYGDECCACIVVSYESLYIDSGYNEEFFIRANFDSLTGCANRYMLDEEINTTDEDIPLGVIYFDLNDLKGVNDKYGHDAGDNYIKSFVKSIVEVVQTTVYRIGGDEFIVIVKDSFDTFSSIIFSLRDLMRKTSMASFGAKYYPNGTNLKNAISECDKLMYLYKADYFNRKSKDTDSKRH